MNLSHCRVCGRSETRLHSISRDLPIHVWPLKTAYPHGHYSADAALFVCESCGHWQLQDLDQDFIAKLYDEGSFLEDETVLKQNRLAHITRALGSTFFSGKKILDVGGGNNPFVGLIPGSENWIADIDPNEAARHTAHGLISGRFEQATVPRAYFDAILSFHSMEHFGRPAAIVEKMDEALAADGSIIIEVPNFPRIIDSLPYYAVFHQHLSLFTLATLDTLMGRGGFARTHTQRNDEVILATYKRHRTVTAWPASPELQELGDRLRSILAGIDRLMRRFHLASRNRIGFYGAGGGASLFLANYPWLRERIGWCFDRDTRKQGRYLPGTAVRISRPEDINSAGIETLFFLSTPVLNAVAPGVHARCVDLSAIVDRAVREQTS